LAMPGRLPEEDDTLTSWPWRVPGRRKRPRLPHKRPQPDHPS